MPGPREEGAEKKVRSRSEQLGIRTNCESANPLEASDCAVCRKSRGVVQAVRDRLMQAGSPPFHGLERGARALRNAFQYQSFRLDFEKYRGLAHGSP